MDTRCKGSRGSGSRDCLGLKDQQRLDQLDREDRSIGYPYVGILWGSSGFFCSAKDLDVVDAYDDHEFILCSCTHEVLCQTTAEEP